MNLSNMNAGTLGDKEMVNDAIASQKYTTSSLNTFAGECVCEQLRQDMLNILKDEHAIQAQLFNEANARGWYPVKQAPVSEINTVRQKFTGQ